MDFHPARIRSGGGVIATGFGTLPASHWPDRPDLFERYCLDVITGELLRQRPGHDLIARPIRATTRLGERGLALDSLERLRIAQALAEALQLAPGGHDETMLQARTFGSLIVAAAGAPQESSAGPQFLSSGSQGAVKRVTHDWDHLAPELEHWRQRFAAARRVVTLVPSHHIYGFLFTIALPAMLGLRVLDARNRLPVALAGQLETGDLVIGHPVFWGMAGGAPWPAGISAVSSGGAVDRAAFRQVAHRCDLAIDVYGSTETAGIGARLAGEEAFTLLPWWERQEDCLAAPGRQPIALPDDAEWLGPRRLNPLRRRDGQVTIAGVTVSPAKVAAVLRAHPLVSDARVRPMRAFEGERLKAFVVPSGPADRLEQALTEWCNERLAPLERPRAYAFGAEVPATAEGKDADWPLA